LCF
jgi:hypothetical protein